MKPSQLRTRLARARKVTGLTQKEFADLTGISLNSIKHYENGDNKLFARHAADITRKTGISAEWLIGFGDESTPLALDGQPLTREKFEALKEGSPTDSESWRTRGEAWEIYLLHQISGVLRGWKGTPMAEELGCLLSEAISDLAGKYHLRILSNFTSVDEVTRFVTKNKQSVREASKPKPAPTKRKKRSS